MLGRPVSSKSVTPVVEALSRYPELPENVVGFQSLNGVAQRLVTVALSLFSLHSLLSRKVRIINLSRLRVHPIRTELVCWSSMRVCNCRIINTHFLSGRSAAW